MLRLVAYLIPVAIVAWGLSWLADRPGSLVINWQGHEVETSVFHAIVLVALLVGFAILAWTIAVQLWQSPAALGAMFNRRRQVRGLEAISSGMIAIGSGDRANATRYAVLARKSLPNEPLTHLLRAQAAQLAGDRTTARRIFETMLSAPETEQLGLRGLFLEAERQGEREAALQFAGRAVELNPKLGWPVTALFELQCKGADWDGALQTLKVARRHQHIDKAVTDRRRAVLLAARAQAIEDSNPDRAMQLALDAHHLANDLIPAAAIAGRILAARGHTKRAAQVVERTWRRAPHPDLATVYAHARLGDSPRDRLDRVKRLGPINQHSIETPIAIATAAIEARAWDVARRSLEPLVEDRLTQRVCLLMARIEGEDRGDTGRVREWLARALHAPRDPSWTADGVVSDRWAPISPVTGAFDAFQWRVPVSALERPDTGVLAQNLEDIIRLSAEKAVINATADRGRNDPADTGGRTAPIERTAPARASEPRDKTRRDETGRSPPAAAVQNMAAQTVGSGRPGAKTEAFQPGAGRADASGPNLPPAEVSVTFSPPRSMQQPVKQPIAGVNGARPKDGQIHPATSHDHVRTSAIMGDEVRPRRSESDRTGREAGRTDRDTAADRELMAREGRIFVAPRAPDDPGLDVVKDEHTAEDRRQKRSEGKPAASSVKSQM